MCSTYQGPPGTGKTATLASLIVAHLMKTDKKVRVSLLTFNVISFRSSLPLLLTLPSISYSSKFSISSNSSLLLREAGESITEDVVVTVNTLQAYHSILYSRLLPSCPSPCSRPVRLPQDEGSPYNRSRWTLPLFQAKYKSQLKKRKITLGDLILKYRVIFVVYQSLHCGTLENFDSELATGVIQE